MGKNDGTFFMCFKDWRSNFSNLFQCINFKDTWSGWRIRDEWTKETCVGPPKKGNFADFALKNPQYVFELKKKSKVYI